MTRTNRKVYTIFDSECATQRRFPEVLAWTRSCRTQKLEMQPCSSLRKDFTSMEIIIINRAYDPRFTSRCSLQVAATDTMTDLGILKLLHFDWAGAPIQIARMTLTIKLDRNWSSFQIANNTPPLSVTSSVIAPSARIVLYMRGRQLTSARRCTALGETNAMLRSDSQCLQVCEDQRSLDAGGAPGKHF
jgi:hypothetical protein